MTDGKLIALAILLGAGLVAWQRPVEGGRSEFSECAQYVRTWAASRNTMANKRSDLRENYQALREGAAQKGLLDVVGKMDGLLAQTPPLGTVDAADLVLSACTYGWSR